MFTTYTRPYIQNMFILLVKSKCIQRKDERRTLRVAPPSFQCNGRVVCNATSSLKKNEFKIGELTAQ